MVINTLDTSKTFYQWMIIDNQVIAIINNLVEGNLVSNGTITLNPPAGFNGGVTLNIANGQIEGNGGRLTGLKTSALDYNSVGVISNTAVIVISGNGALGSNVYLSMAVATGFTDQSSTNVATASQANALYEYVVAAYGKANVASIAFDKANTALAIGNAAIIHANAAFLQANTGVSNAVAAQDIATIARDNANAAFLQANTAFTAANNANTAAGSAAQQAERANGTGTIAHYEAVAAFDKANTSLQKGTTGLITVGYTVTPFNAGGNVAAYGTWRPNYANGQFQYATLNGGVTIGAPTANGAVDILITNSAGATSIAFSGFNVSTYTGETWAATNAYKHLLSIRTINNISTYSWKALQ